MRDEFAASKGFQRARSPKNKQARIAEICTVTRELVQQSSPERVTLTAIGKKLNFTRANLYKYFASVEEIYLQILLDELDAWITAVEENVSAFNKENVADYSPARIWAETLANRSELLTYMQILYSVIENNVRLEPLVEFKKAFFGQFPRLYGVVEQYFPLLPQEQYLRFLQNHIAFALGLAPMCRQTELQRKAMGMAGVYLSQPDFVCELVEFIEMSVQALGAENKMKSDSF